MNTHIKDIIIRDCSTDLKLKALSDLENDINMAKGIINGKYIYCDDCDDYYLAGSFMEKENESFLINVGNTLIKVENTYRICPKGHKHIINKRQS